jgi:hypothetical protein
VAAILCWIEGDRRQAARPPALPPAADNTATQTVTRAASLLPVPLLTRLETLRPTLPADSPGSADVVPPVDPVFPLRLRNTTQPLAQLSLSDTALLLRNAFFDTAIGDRLPVPTCLGGTGSRRLSRPGPRGWTTRSARASRPAAVVSSRTSPTTPTWSVSPRRRHGPRVGGAGRGPLRTLFQTRPSCSPVL